MSEDRVLKIGELTDVSIQEQNSPVVVEMPNGHQVTTTGYHFGTDKRGNPVIIIRAGKSK